MFSVIPGMGLLYARGEEIVKTKIQAAALPGFPGFPCRDGDAAALTDCGERQIKPALCAVNVRRGGVSVRNIAEQKEKGIF